MTFLGHLIDGQGIRPLPDKVQALVDYPQPTTRHKLREFLGLVNFYHRFLPNCACILSPLNKLLGTSVGENKELVWSDDAAAAFNKIKDTLADAALLTHPKPGAPLAIATDASEVAVGAVLQQFVDDMWQPISFFSKTLKPAETRYSTFDRELLAIYLSIKHFHHIVEGEQFCILTDHKPLTFLSSFRPDQHSPHQTRHLDYILQFTSDIRHIKGSDNPVADAFSRVNIGALSPNTPSVVDLGKMADAQCNDPDLIHWSSATSSLDLRPMPLPQSDKTIICDWSTGIPRPFVPDAIVANCLMHYILFLILASEPPSDSLLLALFGPRLMWTFVDGLVPVFSANGPRSRDIQSLHCLLSSLLALVLISCT